MLIVENDKDEAEYEDYYLKIEDSFELEDQSHKR